MKVLLFFALGTRVVAAADATSEAHCSSEKTESAVSCSQHDSARGYPKIARKQWEPSRPFKEELVSQRQPVVLTNTVAESWAARSKWNPAYLRSKVKDVVKGVYRNTQPRFGPLWRESKPLAKEMTSLVNRNLHEVVDLSADTFFDQVSASSEQDSYVYYTGGLDSEELSDDIQPLDMLKLEKVEHIAAWIGQSGCVTSLHADTYENFFVQLYGTKRFVLFPPSEPVYPFPFLHPSFFQSQLNLSSLDSARFPDSAELKGFEVVLGPGDLLYIPPLWWHEVEALQASISVNVWSKSRLQGLFDEAIGMVVGGVKHEWNDVSKRGAAILIVKQALRRVPVLGFSSEPSFAGPGVAFIEHLLQTRYSPLEAAAELSAATVVPEFDLCPPLSPKEKRQMMKLGKDIATSKLASLPDGSRGVMLGNFVEALAYWSNGRAADSLPFLRKCFATM